MSDRFELEIAREIRNGFRLLSISVTRAILEAAASMEDSDLSMDGLSELSTSLVQQAQEEISWPEICPTCDGEGKVGFGPPVNTRRTCPACEGSGEVEAPL
jgi:DnaJ-class molecular chaperone